MRPLDDFITSDEADRHRDTTTMFMPASRHCTSLERNATSLYWL